MEDWTKRDIYMYNRGRNDLLLELRSQFAKGTDANHICMDLIDTIDKK